MPKIKVYKHDGKAVPVDRAKVANGFECPWTKKIYLTKKSYLHHLKSVREEHIRTINRSRRMNIALNDLHSQPNFIAIRNWLETNSWFVLANAKQRRTFAESYDKWPDPEDFWFKIHYFRGNFSNTVDNSHSCPRGGVKNWGGLTRDLPTGYPGWSGRIIFEMSHDLPGWGNDILKGTGINTGTGGAYGKTTYAYDFKMFLDDWKGLEKQHAWDTLKGLTHTGFTIGEDK